MLQATPPFIAGRGRERASLLTCLDASLAGRGTLAIVSGEAGIGKSTLAGWIASQAGERGATVLSGGCYDLSATAPYGPWIEIIRGWRRGHHGDMPSNPETIAGPAGTGGQATFFEDVAAFLRAACAIRPLLLILEDLHWADDASLDLLRVIARETQQLPIMLLTTWRAEAIGNNSHLARLLPLIVRESGAERIDIKPLTPPDIADLVHENYSIGDDDRDRIVAYLEQHAGGNPLFAVELLRTLEDEGVIVRHRDGCQIGDTTQLRLPFLLRQMIEGRLARLTGDTRQRLNAAAVIGQDVPLELWRAVTGADDDMMTVVTQAVDADVLTAAPDGTSLHFRHALIREVLYQSILPPERRRQHQRIASIVETLASPDPDTIAWHYRMAADERAVSWLIRAGERAQRAYAWTMAADRLEAALDLMAATSTAAERGWLSYRIGRLRRHADPSGAITWLADAERIGQQAGDEVLRAYAGFDLGHTQVLTGDYRHGLAAMIAGDAILTTLPTGHTPLGSDVEAWVADTLPSYTKTVSTRQPHHPRRGTLIQWLVEPGRLDEALALGEPYVTDLTRTADHDEQTLSSLADAWFGLGRLYAARGEPAGAVQALNAALECYGRISHHLLMSSTHRVLLAEVIIPYYPDDLRWRRRVAAAAEQAWRRSTGALRGDTPPQMATIEAALLDGEWQVARALLEPATLPGVSIATWHERACTLLARLARDQGNRQHAWEWIRAVLPAGPGSAPGATGFVRAIEASLVAVDLALDVDDEPLAAAWLAALDHQIAWCGATRWRPTAQLRHAHVAMHRGQPDRARNHAESALEFATSPRQPLDLCDVHRFLGELDTATGRHTSAAEHLTAARTIAEACVAPYPRALTLLAIAELHVATGQRFEATQLCDEALAILEPLGATPAVERASRILTKDNARPFGLSRREREVLDFVAQGMTDAEIAERLSISYRTVTTHLTAIFTKLNVNSRVAATRIAVEEGLVR